MKKKLARVLVDDAAGRYSAGEVGEVLENTSEKYDWFLDLGECDLPEAIGGGKGRRRFYFYSDEAEPVDG